MIYFYFEIKVFYLCFYLFHLFSEIIYQTNISFYLINFFNLKLFNSKLKNSTYFNNEAIIIVNLLIYLYFYY